MKKYLRIVYLFLSVLMISQSCVNSNEQSDKYNIMISDSLLRSTISDFIVKNNESLDDFIVCMEYYHSNFDKVYRISYFPKKMIGDRLPSFYTQINGHYVLIYTGFEEAINGNKIKQELINKNIIIVNDGASFTYKDNIWDLIINLEHNGEYKLLKYNTPPPPLGKLIF